MYDSLIAVIHKDAADWGHALSRGVVQAFHSLGMQAEMFAVDGKGEAVIEFFGSLVKAGHSPFLFDINGRIDTQNAPKFSWVVDHPLVHLQLARAGTHTVLGTIDAAHARLTGYSPAPAVFVPHGGPEPDERPLTWDERDIDVLFVGNIPPLAPRTTDLERLAAEAGNQAGRIGTDPFDELLAALSSVGLAVGSFDRQGFATLLSIATDHSQYVQRVSALRSVRSARLHVAGLLPPGLAADLAPSATVGGYQASFTEVCNLMRRSRVVINLSSKFPHGSHERIWHAMACGAAVVTNRSSFVEQDFIHGEHIYYYDRPEEVGALVDVALSDRAGARAAEAARPIYQASHTWEDRAARILSAMNRLAPS